MNATHLNLMNMLPSAELARHALLDADKDKSGYMTSREFLESLTNLDESVVVCLYCIGSRCSTGGHSLFR